MCYFSLLLLSPPMLALSNSHKRRGLGLASALLRSVLQNFSLQSTATSNFRHTPRCLLRLPPTTRPLLPTSTAPVPACNLGFAAHCVQHVLMARPPLGHLSDCRTTVPVLCRGLTLLSLSPSTVPRPHSQL